MTGIHEVLTVTGELAIGLSQAPGISSDPILRRIGLPDDRPA